MQKIFIIVCFVIQFVGQLVGLCLISIGINRTKNFGGYYVSMPILIGAIICTIAAMLGIFGTIALLLIF